MGVSQPTFATRLNAPDVRRTVRSAGRGEAIHSLFFIIMIAYACAGPFIKITGIAGLFGMTAVVYTYVIFARAFYFYPYLFLFTILGFAYLVLSFADILPDAWTQMYRSDLILRHGYFVFLFYPLVSAAHRFWRHALETNQLDFYAALCLIITLVTNFAFNIFYYGWIPWGLPGLLNKMQFLVLGLSILMFTRYRDLRIFIAVFFAAWALMFSAGAQTPILGLFILALTLVPLRNLVLLGTIGLLIFLTVISAFYVDQLVDKDPNLVFRTLTWFNAMIGVWESFFIGIGFGKEVVVGWYQQLGNLGPNFENPSLLILQGVHNSFLSTTFRMGIVGGLLFFMFFVFTCYPSKIRDPRLAQAATVAYFAAFLSTFVNVGIESPTSVFGLSFGLGFVLAAKDVTGRAYEGYLRSRAQQQKPLP